MIKLYKCNCKYCIYPFGNGAPVCIRIMEQTRNRKDMIQCTEKGCKFYEELKRYENGKV